MLAASLKPKRAGIQLASQSPRVWLTRMMNKDSPRKKSRRGSRNLAGLAVTSALRAGAVLPSNRQTRTGVQLVRKRGAAGYTEGDDNPDRAAKVLPRVAGIRAARYLRHCKIISRQASISPEESPSSP